MKTDFGLRSVMLNPLPHISYCIFEETTVTSDPMLEEIASVMGAFSAKTEYLGIFTGERPVIFIGVAKSPKLASLHKSLCKVLCEAVDSKAAVYSETHWIPHITLAYGDDVNRSNIGPVMERLAFKDFHHEFVIDNLAVLEEIPEKGIVVSKSFRLTCS